MAADSDGDLIETVVTCEGDLTDPEFPQKFEIIVDRLNALLCKGRPINIKFNDSKYFISIMYFLNNIILINRLYLIYVFYNL